MINTHTSTTTFSNNTLAVIPGISDLTPAGRLPYCLHNWLSITSDEWVLQVVRGYQLELSSIPTQRTPPRVIEMKNGHLVTEEVCKLLTKGAIKVVPPSSNQFLSRIFVVPKRDGSHRPVVNLRPLNQFMVNIHFKMESLNMMRDLLRQGDWMVSTDLKDAYLSVTVWEGH